jgi:hypothetical protein
VTLADKYDLARQRVYITGSQAVVRLLLMQKERDRRAGLNTAGFVSGYRGSPVGTVDNQFVAARRVLEPRNIVFQPGLNTTDIQNALARPQLMGGGQRFTHSQSLVVRLETDSGLVGWGEASAAPTMTGETLPGMKLVADRVLLPVLERAPVLQRATFERRLERAISGNTAAKCAVNVALYDLLGRHYKVPVHALLGGLARTRGGGGGANEEGQGRSVRLRSGRHPPVHGRHAVPGP